jgi:hypothetical protein
VIKLEPKGETELQPGGILDPGADGEIDPLALNTDRADPIVEQEDLPCPLAFLALESKAEVSSSILHHLKQTFLNLRPTLFRDFMRYRMVISYHHYGTTSQSQNISRELQCCAV